MQIKYILPVLAATGFLFASYTVVSSNQAMPIASAVAEPASAPFQAFIAGAGIVEAQSQNIAVGTALSGIVSKINVSVNTQVKAGDVLFMLDDRQLQAELAIKRANLVKATAGVNEAQALRDQAQALNKLAESVSDRRAISAEELLKRRNALLIATAQVASANALVQQAEAELASSQITLDRLAIRAPVDGSVLQVNIRCGEFAQAGGLTTPLLVLGNLQQLHVRVDIDENDAWRFAKHSKAVAYLRGNRDVKVELNLAYLEPYIIPKKSLTGDSTERVDMRVLQALYRFDQQQLPIYVGQQMDVFIEASGDASRASSPNAEKIGGL